MWTFIHVASPYWLSLVIRICLSSEGSHAWRINRRLICANVSAWRKENHVRLLEDFETSMAQLNRGDYSMSGKISGQLNLLPDFVLLSVVLGVPEYISVGFWTLRMLYLLSNSICPLETVLRIFFMKITSCRN